MKKRKKQQNKKISHEYIEYITWKHFLHMQNKILFGDKFMHTKYIKYGQARGHSEFQDRLRREGLRAYIYIYI